MVLFDHVWKFNLLDVDLHIPKGTVLGVIGSSGSGKTTFLRLASGLLEPYSGHIRICGKDPVSQRKEISSLISVLFANVPVYSDKSTIMEGLLESKTIYGLSDEEFRDNLEHVSDLLAFGSLQASKARDLSLGQKRRAELGMAFLRNVSLYIFDEPCIGLDQNGKEAFKQLAFEKKKEGASLLVSSHDMEEIAGISDRILVLDEGKVFFYGSPEELHKRLIPMEVCTIEYSGRCPDISDIEIEKLTIEKNVMKIWYNSNHVSSREVLERICDTTTVGSVNVRRTGLGEIIKSAGAGRN